MRTLRLRAVRSLTWRIALRTALAVFLALNLAGAALVVVAERTTSGQVEGVLQVFVRSITLDPTVAGEGESLCRLVRQQPVTSVAGVTDVVAEVHGPDGVVCRQQHAPSLDPLVWPGPVTRWLTGTALRRAYPPGAPTMLVLEQQLAGGWSARFGGDLAASDRLAGRLLATLGLVGLVGALGALLVGRGVARSGLRPVRDLAHAAETIAHTQDLSVRIDIRGTSGDDEIDRLATAFNRMTSALAQARERQAQLVVDAGHELRTPLTSLRANLELLVRSERAGRPLPAKHRSALLDDLTGQLEELTCLVAEVVVLARDEPDRPRLDVRLDDVARRAVERAQRRADGHRVETELEPCVVPDADAEALERAIINLLDNALKFSPPGSIVHVCLAVGGGTAEGTARFTVDDAGPGVAPEHRAEAFERFWRADDARSLPGSGLGLAIVAETASAHGGTAHLDSAPGGGTRAILTLPSNTPSPSPSPSPRDHARRHILWISLPGAIHRMWRRA